MVYRLSAEQRHTRLQELGVQYDAEDLDKILQYTWRISKKGYVEASSYFADEPKTIKLHRLVLGSLDDPREVDHINRNKLDNRKANLRYVDALTNSNNRAFLESAQHIRERAGKFELRISRNGSTLCRVFSSMEDAKRARDDFITSGIIPSKAGGCKPAANV